MFSHPFGAIQFGANGARRSIHEVCFDDGWFNKLFWGAFPNPLVLASNFVRQRMHAPCTRVKARFDRSARPQPLVGVVLVW